MKVLGLEIRRAGAPDAAPALRADPPLTRAHSSEVSGTQNPKAWLTEIGWGGPVPTRTNLPRVTPDRAELHGTVFACCNNIAGDLSKVPLKLWQRDASGRETRVREHALPYLLNVESSPGVSARTLRYIMVYAWALRGNGYAYAPRTGAGDVDMIELPKDGQAPQLLASGRARFYQFEDQGGVIRRVPARSMAHLRYAPVDGWNGRSPIMVAAESMGLMLARQEAAARTATGGTAKGFIKLADHFESEADRDRNARKIKDVLSDPKADGFPVLGPDDSIESLDLSAADQELLSSQKFDREQIAAIYRMPPSKLQMLEYGVKANGQQQAIDYRSDCLLHWGCLSEGDLSMALLTREEREAGLFLRYDYGALLEPTTKEKYEAISRAVGGPWRTPNEAREMDGLPPIDGGESLNPAPNMTRDDSAKDGGDGNDSEGDDE